MRIQIEVHLYIQLIHISIYARRERPLEIRAGVLFFCATDAVSHYLVLLRLKSRPCIGGIKLADTNYKPVAGQEVDCSVSIQIQSRHFRGKRLNDHFQNPKDEHATKHLSHDADWCCLFPDKCLRVSDHMESEFDAGDIVDEIDEEQGSE